MLLDAGPQAGPPTRVRANNSERIPPCGRRQREGRQEAELAPEHRDLIVSHFASQPGAAQFLAQGLGSCLCCWPRRDLHVRERGEMTNSSRPDLLRFDPYSPRQDPLRTVTLAELFDMIHAVEQRHDDAIAQFLRRDSTKCRLERRCLDGDPHDIKVSIKQIGDLHRCLESSEHLTLDAHLPGIVIPAASPYEEGHPITGLRERATHETTDPIRSENRMSHGPPPSIPLLPIVYRCRKTWRSD